MQTTVSRRGFIAGTAAAGIASGAAVAGVQAAHADEVAWASEYDVVVAGTGFAGIAAAYEAAAAGASVLVVEKAPEEDAGGNSRVCAQAIWCPTNPQNAAIYMKEITGPYHMHGLTDEMIDTYVAEAGMHREWLLDEFDFQTLGGLVSCEYPNAESATLEGVADVTCSTVGINKSVLWDHMWAQIRETAGIEFAFSTPLEDLVFGAGGEVVGVVAGGKPIKAKKGVIMALGGFEFNDEMKGNYLHCPSWAWGTPYNTGDGHKICQKYDIAFWHMNSATIGTRVGLTDIDFLPSRDLTIDAEVSNDNGYFWCDKYGKRYMDESRPYMHGYAREAMYYQDSVKLEYPRIPSWQILDETSLAHAGEPQAGWHYQVLGENFVSNVDRLIESGKIVKADSVEELAVLMGVEADVLAATYADYSAHAAEASADEFGRPGENFRVMEPPFYAMPIVPIMVNTNGGPKRNAQAAVLKTDGTPVPRLYSAGEFGSVWAFYYQGAGNVSECLAFGRIAGRNAAANEAWDA